MKLFRRDHLYIICLPLLLLFTLNLTGCGSKETKFVNQDNPERYYLINEDTYVYHRDDKSEVETGHVIIDDTENTISFVETGDTSSDTEYFYDGNFFGEPLFEITKDHVLNNGTAFEIEDAEARTTFIGISIPTRVRMYKDGNYAIMGMKNGAGDIYVEKGTYSVQKNVITLEGKSTTYRDGEQAENAMLEWFSYGLLKEEETVNGDGKQTKDAIRKWYYKDGPLYGTVYYRIYVKE